MIELTTYIKRGNWFWEDRPLSDAVKIYKKELLKAKKELKELPYGLTQVLTIADKSIKEIQSRIDRELSFCDFYEFYIKEQKKPNFNQWVFKTKKQLQETARKKGMDSWEINKFKGDQWEKTNGKIKIRIVIEDKISSIRVSLHISNSATTELPFFLDNNYGEKEIIYSNLFKKESVDKRLNEYKSKAEEFFEEYKYPLYCYEKRQIDILKQLLWIE